MRGVELLAGWLGVAPPPVEPPSAPLTWDAPAECPGEAVVEAEVRRLLGGEDPSLEGVTVEGRIEAGAEAGWVLDLVVSTSQGTSTRRMEASECKTLAEAAALYIVLAIDPMAMLGQEPAGVTEEKPEGGVTEDGEPEGGEPEGGEPEGGEPEGGEPKGEVPRRRPGLALRALGAVGGGIHPRTGGAVGAGLSLRLRGVRLELLGEYWFRRRHEVDDLPGVGTRTDIGFAELRVCPHGVVRRVELLGCAGVDVGAATARGMGVFDRRIARAPWIGVVVGPAVNWHPIERLGLWVEPNVVLSAYRPRFAVDGVGEVLRLGVVGGRLTLGVQIEL